MKKGMCLFTVAVLVLAFSAPSAFARGRHRHGPYPEAGVYASVRQPGFSISVTIPWYDPPPVRYRPPRRVWIPGHWEYEPVWVPGRYDKIRKHRYGRDHRGYRWGDGDHRGRRGGYRMKGIRRLGG